MSGGFFGGFSEGLDRATSRKEDSKLRSEENARQDKYLDVLQSMGAIPQVSSQGGYDGTGTPPFIPMGDGDDELAGGAGNDVLASSSSEPRPMPLGARPDRPVGKKDFIEAMMPHALRVSEETGLDPRLIIAQAAQETGWGKSAPGNNYFGIKSHGKAGGNTMATNEVINGKTIRINDSFRGYQNMGESVDGYGSFLKANPRYKPMLAAKDLDSQLAALGRSGYATDPNYERSVGSIARSIELPQRHAEAPRPTASDRATMRAQWPEFASVSDAQLDSVLGNEKLKFGAKLRPMGVGPV
ncbi:glucosaminidase domain-containing protein [Sulfitobacter sp. R18_1]|uniref:glycoside hydrolase family 73 protein n=1 Tax=Sulfitobacter sp. R18_1 TaxID=2821104 RepID=UPI001ADB0DEA|nr:glucosaminidase domain-containing protein [Sulfitobacter sp. R18_1]MBO9430629.1 glucosaminidase domain-containing protein [Sulfitobacter sp. R18_1]